MQVTPLSSSRSLCGQVSLGQQQMANSLSNMKTVLPPQNNPWAHGWLGKSLHTADLKIVQFLGSSPTDVFKRCLDSGFRTPKLCVVSTSRNSFLVHRYCLGFHPDKNLLFSQAEDRKLPQRNSFVLTFRQEKTPSQISATTRIPCKMAKDGFPALSSKSKGLDVHKWRSPWGTELKLPQAKSSGPHAMIPAVKRAEPKRYANSCKNLASKSSHALRPAASLRSCKFPPRGLQARKTFWHCSN